MWLLNDCSLNAVGNAALLPHVPAVLFDALLTLGQAQQQLENQCRRKLQRKGISLNILVTALSGIEAERVCKHMFSDVSHSVTTCPFSFYFFPSSVNSSPT